MIPARLRLKWKLRDMRARVVLWVARRITDHYAAPYMRAYRDHGYAWVSELIDEDIETYGNAYVHTLVRAGIIDEHNRRADGGAR